MAEVETASAPATNGAARVEYELQLYYWVKLIRGFEDRVSRLHRQNKILGGVYSGAGQEAICHRHLRAIAGRAIWSRRSIATSASS